MQEPALILCFYDINSSLIRAKKFEIPLVLLKWLLCGANINILLSEFVGMARKTEREILETVNLILGNLKLQNSSTFSAFGYLTFSPRCIGHSLTYWVKPYWHLLITRREKDFSRKWLYYHGKFRNGRMHTTSFLRLFLVAFH